MAVKLGAPRLRVLFTCSFTRRLVDMSLRNLCYVIIHFQFNDFFACWDDDRVHPFSLIVATTLAFSTTRAFFLVLGLSGNCQTILDRKFFTSLLWEFALVWIYLIIYGAHIYGENGVNINWGEQPSNHTQSQVFNTPCSYYQPRVCPHSHPCACSSASTTRPSRLRLPFSHSHSLIGTIVPARPLTHSVTHANPPPSCKAGATLADLPQGNSYNKMYSTKFITDCVNDQALKVRVETGS